MDRKWEGKVDIAGGIGVRPDYSWNLTIKIFVNHGVLIKIIKIWKLECSRTTF